MKTKTIVSVLLLAFVAVSIAVAFRKIAPSGTTPQQADSNSSLAESADASVALDAKLAETQFTAVYFHAPHRCPTCRKIESFSHEALTPEIESGKIAWTVADYTSNENETLVDQFKVFAPTVVLVEVQDGKVVRWKNLEEVWDHTSDQVGFTAFINQAWSEFKAS
ncbi:nitrophenyl compound nitroreductase subunit ArsF family protein [Pirellulaceae bacterium SH449]